MFHTPTKFDAEAEAAKMRPREKSSDSALSLSGARISSSSTSRAFLENAASERSGVARRRRRVLERSDWARGSSGAGADCRAAHDAAALERLVALECRAVRRCKVGEGGGKLVLLQRERQAHGAFAAFRRIGGGEFQRPREKAAEGLGLVGGSAEVLRLDEARGDHAAHDRAADGVARFRQDRALAARREDERRKRLDRQGDFPHLFQSAHILSERCQEKFLAARKRAANLAEAAVALESRRAQVGAGERERFSVISPQKTRSSASAACMLCSELSRAVPLSLSISVWKRTVVYSSRTSSGESASMRRV